MRARRVETWAELFADEGGAYMRKQDGTWMAKTPNGHLGNLAAHEVEEHEDGTITVSPSILVSDHTRRALPRLPKARRMEGVVISAIVFSKDRAAQLDLLLRSLTENANGIFWPISVLWRATRDEFSQGYARCIAEHPEAAFIAEDSLTYQVRALVESAGHLVCFFTDDDVLYRSLADDALHEHALNREDVICFSLRLGRNTTVCYPHARQQQFPKQLHWADDMLLWEWEQADGDFSYPFSLDGHIVRKAELLTLLNGHHFSTPNFLEDILMRNPQSLRCPLMASYAESHLVSIPANQVSESHGGNRHGQLHPVSAADLNERYISGQQIDLTAMDFSSVCGAHHELPFVFR